MNCSIVAASSPPKRGAVMALVNEVPAVEAAGFIVDVDERDATLWTIALVPKLLKQHGLHRLVSELKQWAQCNRKPEAIVLEVRFRTRHPDEPPFIRVVRPRFVFHTGHVTVGGSICTRMLTSDGWIKSMTIDAALRAVCENLNDGDARIDMRSAFQVDYTLQEATIAFSRVAADHGWRL